MSGDLRARDASVTITGMIGAKTFVGTSGAGQFPPTNVEYETFGFRPQIGVGGIVAFRGTMPNGKDHFFEFCQYHWDGGRVVVGHNILSPKNSFSQVIGLGLMVVAQFNGKVNHYVTETPKTLDRNYKVVEIQAILKYIEGKTSLADLDASAHELIWKAAAVKSLEQLEEELQLTRQLLAETEQRVAMGNSEIARLDLVVKGKNTEIIKLCQQLGKAGTAIGQVSFAVYNGLSPWTSKSEIQKMLEKQGYGIQKGE